MDNIYLNMISEMDSYAVVIEGLITGSAEFRSFTRDKKDFYRSEYLSYDDPSGYIFAEAWVEDGYRKWVEMQNAFGVKDEFKEWKNTLEMKLQTQGIINIARQKDPSFQAAKWLADPWLG